MPSIGLSLSLPFAAPAPAVGGDTTPGGAADVWLMEASGGWLMEDGTSYWLME